MMDDILELFCTGAYEYSINSKMLYYNYQFPTDSVLDYVHSVISLPVDVVLEACTNEFEYESIAPRDVFQFSDLEDGTFRICRKLKEIQNPGVSHLDAGSLLLDDGKERNNVALTKYGENHLKTAAALGLLFEMAHVYFLSCIGYIADLLTEEEQAKLLVRLALRNKVVLSMLVAAQAGEVDARKLFGRLSDSTYIRRRSNIKAILRILLESDEFHFAPIVSRIYFV